MILVGEKPPRVKGGKSKILPDFQPLLVKSTHSPNTIVPAKSD